MKWRIIFLVLFLQIASITATLYAQDEINSRLDSLEQKSIRIEAKLDTLLAIARGQALVTVEGEIISDDLNLRWGIISERGTLLDKNYFVINHNNVWKIPYWVGYYLTSADLLGTQGRTDDFRIDPQLPDGSRSDLADYRNSGYDRGHNAPAADFKRSREAMSTTFLLSNMSPQTPNLNRQIWRILEEEIRTLVNENGEAWIITGNLFLSVDSHMVAPFEFIGSNKVAVPTHCFKVILTSQEDGTYRMYAFLLPNQRDPLPGKPADYILAVDRLERITGYDFFPILDDSLENRLESIIPDSWIR